jgi:hypothetical protein
MNQPVTDFGYTIEAEDGKDKREAVITKTGLKAQFTLMQVYADYDRLTKQLQEQEGQVKLTGAQAKNIEENHAFVATMSREDLFTAALYFEVTKQLKTAEDAVNKLKEAITMYDAEIQKIQEDLNLPTRHEFEVAEKEKVAQEQVASETSTAEAAKEVTT